MAFIYQKHETYAVLETYIPDDATDTVCVPDRVDGLPVVRIAPKAFYEMRHLKRVLLPMTLEEIGDEAFAFCANLRCVGIKESEDLSVFPPALRSVGMRAFFRTDLRAVSFSSPKIRLEDGAFCDSRITEALFAGSEVSLGAGVFAHCRELALVALPDAEVELLAPWAFLGCGELKWVKAKSIAAVDTQCFKGCENLVELSARKPLRYVGDGAFEECWQLNTTEYFRTMFDLICARGLDVCMERAVQWYLLGVYGERYTPGGVLEPIAQHASKGLLDKICRTPRGGTTDAILLYADGAACADGEDGDWDEVDRFYLCSAEKILEEFKPIAQWEDILREADREDGDLEYVVRELPEDVLFRAVCIQNSPQPYLLDWEETEVLLNARMMGRCSLGMLVTGAQFLSNLLATELFGQRDEYYEKPVHKILEQFLGKYAQELDHAQRISRLRWDVLYNRLTLYRELKNAYYRLKAQPEE